MKNLGLALFKELYNATIRSVQPNAEKPAGNFSRHILSLTPAVRGLWGNHADYSCGHIDSKYEISRADNLLEACLNLNLDIPYFAGTQRWEALACRQCAVKQYQMLRIPAVV